VPLALEYEATLRQMLPTSRFSAEDIGSIIDYLCRTGDRQEIFFLWRPLLTDPGDDMILELAVAGMCSHIVTFNTSHFSGAESFGISVVRPADFLSQLRGKS
jgi:predicted nucleic acid-binding protein